MEKIKGLLHKILNKEFILYVVFGVLTTLINIGVFYVCNDLVHIHYLVSNMIAWILSVLFAYITNKIFVFESKGVRGKALLKEFWLFIAARLLSLGIDEAGMLFLVGAIAMNETIAKIIMNVIVVILNYIFSKWIIFKKKEA